MPLAEAREYIEVLDRRLDCKSDREDRAVKEGSGNHT